MNIVRIGVAAVGLVAVGAGLVTSLAACPFPTAGVFDAYMSIDGQRRQSEFYTDMRNIVCTADIRGSDRRPLTTEMLIRQEQVLDYKTQTAENKNSVLVYVDFSGPGEKVLELKPAERDAGTGQAEGSNEAKPFPAGRFRCEIYVEGELKETLPFNVLFAPCPARFIEDGATCGGYYEANRQCPRGGLGIPTATLPLRHSISRRMCATLGSCWLCPCGEPAWRM